MARWEGMAPSWDDALRVRYDDPCTNTDAERATARAYVARHALSADDAATLLRMIGLDS